MPRKLDFEEPGRQEGSFRIQLRLCGHPLYVYVNVLGSDLQASREVQGLIGLTPDELGLCNSLDAALSFIFAWLEGEKEPEEGELFLANPAVKNYQINRHVFLLDVHKVLRRKSGGREVEKRLLVIPRKHDR